MAQYDMPKDEFNEQIGNSDISPENKAAIDALFAGKDNVNVGTYDPENPPEGADVIIVPEGTELTGDPGGALIIFQGGASGEFEAGDEPRAIIAQSGDNQTLIFTGDGQVTVETGAGSDIITVAPGVEATIDTGEGFDGVVITKSGGNVSFEIDADGNLLVTGSSYTLAGVEVVQFTDSLSVIAQDEDQAIVARLYQILFDREPDMEGLEYWFDTLQDASFGDGTYDMWDVTHAFMNSDEFAAKYADLTDEEYLTELYLGMTGRAPDAEGMSYWLDVLANPEEMIAGWTGDGDNAYVHVNYAFAYSSEATEAMGLDGTQYIVPLYDMAEEV